MAVDEKKKRRRKRTTRRKKKTSKKVVPSPQEREEEAADIQSTQEPSKGPTGIERLNSIPDYTKTLQKDIVAKTYAKYQTMTLNELKERGKDPNNTVLELSIIAQCIRAIKGTGTVSLSITRYIHDRIDGKTKERIEYSGPNGGPIETKTTETFDIENMNKKQRDQYRKMLMEMQKLPKKVDSDGDASDS